MDVNTDSDSTPSSSEGFFKLFKNKVKGLFSKNTAPSLQDLIENRDDAEEPLSEEEQQLITSVLKFSDIDAGTACVPRSDIVYLSKDDDFDKVVNTFKSSGYSRLIVCGKDLDEVVGFLTLKDVIQYMGEDKPFTLRNVMRPCTFVPESLSIPSVLDEMRNNTVQIAVVVDEYGGTAGLITVKDIMEELVGDLDDENEQQSEDEIIELAGGRYQLDARIEIEDLDEKLCQALGVSENEEYETLAGFVLDLAGRVPDEGAVIDLETGGRLLVTQSDGRRIQKVTYVPATKKNS